MAIDQTILAVDQLRVQFQTEQGEVQAIRGISIELQQGETLAIVGESGSGKSVTALSVLRLLEEPPAQITNGQISLRNPSTDQHLDLLEISKKQWQDIRGNRIAMIFQEPMTSLNPVFTCGDQVMEAILAHQKCSAKEAKAQTLQLFKQVQLPDPDRIFTAYPHQISGGQKQRVMIAMAISCNPDILIADEPTTALDVTVQKSILELLNDLKKAVGMSVIFITHDLGVVSQIADRVAVMYKGELVETGDTQSIFKQAAHPYTKSLLACRPPLDYRMSKLPTVQDFLESNISDATIETWKVSPEAHQARQGVLQSQDPILRVHNLHTWFPKERNFWGKPKSYVHAVDGVSFQVYPGETLGLVGESGCGKTTLGRTIMRLEPATSGEIWYQNTNLLTLSPNALKAFRPKMQIIFQDPYSALNPRMTIGQAIVEPMEIHQLQQSSKDRSERAIHLLETVGLSADHFSRYPHEFSGGQRQRICIARALALEPEFIICDESVSALDVSVQAQVLNLLMDLREKFKLTYIFISHDLSVVKFMSDRLLVMHRGKIVESGDADEVYRRPKEAYTKQLIDAIPK